MVRINLINTERLMDQHLVAEYNEIQMLFGYINKYPHIVSYKMPAEYTLGRGHIMFFKDKCKYLLKRLFIVRAEMWERGFETADIDYDHLLRNIGPEHFGDYEPTDEAFKIIEERIYEKLGYYDAYYRYRGSIKTRDEARQILLDKDLK